MTFSWELFSKHLKEVVGINPVLKKTLMSILNDNNTILSFKEILSDSKNSNEKKFIVLVDTPILLYFTTLIYNEEKKNNNIIQTFGDIYLNILFILNFYLEKEEVEGVVLLMDKDTPKSKYVKRKKNSKLNINFSFRESNLEKEEDDNDENSLFYLFFKEFFIYHPVLNEKEENEIKYMQENFEKILEYSKKLSIFNHFGNTNKEEEDVDVNDRKYNNLLIDYLEDRQFKKFIVDLLCKYVFYDDNNINLSKNKFIVVSSKKNNFIKTEELIMKKSKNKKNKKTDEKQISIKITNENLFDEKKKKDINFYEKLKKNLIFFTINYGEADIIAPYFTLNKEFNYIIESSDGDVLKILLFNSKFRYNNKNNCWSNYVFQFRNTFRRNKYNNELCYVDIQRTYENCFNYFENLCISNNLQPKINYGTILFFLFSFVKSDYVNNEGIKGIGETYSARGFLKFSKYMMNNFIVFEDFKFGNEKGYYFSIDYKKYTLFWISCSVSRNTKNFSQLNFEQLLNKDVDFLKKNYILSDKISLEVFDSIYCQLVYDINYCLNQSFGVNPKITGFEIKDGKDLWGFNEKNNIFSENSNKNFHVNKFNEIKKFMES